MLGIYINKILIDFAVFNTTNLKTSMRYTKNCLVIRLLWPSEKYRELIKHLGKMQEELKQQIQTLRDSLTGDMFNDMDVRDEIHNLEMKLNGVKPSDSHFECVGCGS